MMIAQSAMRVRTPCFLETDHIHSTVSGSLYDQLNAGMKRSNLLCNRGCGGKHDGVLYDSHCCTTWWSQLFSGSIYAIMDDVKSMLIGQLLSFFVDRFFSIWLRNQFKNESFSNQIFPFKLTEFVLRRVNLALGWTLLPANWFSNCRTQSEFFFAGRVGWNQRWKPL